MYMSHSQTHSLASCTGLYNAPTIAFCYYKDTNKSAGVLHAKIYINLTKEEMSVLPEMT